jgi:DNA-binding response OmpR family regulator
MVNPHSVLVVDDDENLADALSLLLRAQRYEVFTAFGGFQGYAEYFNHPTDFVVTDIQMSAMDGSRGPSDLTRRPSTPGMNLSKALTFRQTTGRRL